MQHFDPQSIHIKQKEKKKLQITPQLNPLTQLININNPLTHRKSVTHDNVGSTFHGYLVLGGEREEEKEGDRGGGGGGEEKCRYYL